MTSKDLFFKRLQRLATEKKVAQADMARALGKTTATISRWWNGDIVPGQKNMMALSEYFSCNIDWLKNGIGEIYPNGKPLRELPNFSPAPPPRNAPRQIPIISWVQAGDWQDVFDPYQPGYAEDWITTTETTHPNAFGLAIHGDSMEPEFQEGDIITVDPGREAISGSYVVAKNGQEATFKQLVIDGNNVYLKPLNTRYPIKDVTGMEIKIVGVVVEKRKRY